VSRAVLCLLPAILALSGCKIIPTYHLPKGAEYAKLDLKDNGANATARLCVDDQLYNLSKDADGYARVPSGQRLSVGIFYYNYVYRGVSSSCEASSSFIPVSNSAYYLDFEIEAERCTALVYREGVSSRVGLGFEPSLGRSGRCGTR
jgi:hypothetical protein